MPWPGICWRALLLATACHCLPMYAFNGAGTLRLRLASVSSPHSYDLCPRLPFTACDNLQHQAQNTQMQFICCAHIALLVFLTSFSTRGHVRHSSHVRRMAAASRNRCLVSSFLLFDFVEKQPDAAFAFRHVQCVLSVCTALKDMHVFM